MFLLVQPPPELIHPNDSYYFQPTSLPLPYAWSHAAAPHVTAPSEHQNYYPQTYPTHHIQPWDDAVITHTQPVSTKICVIKIRNSEKKFFEKP